MPPVGYSEQIRAIEAFSSPCLFVFKLQAFIGGKDVLVSLPTGYGKSLSFALLPCDDEKSGYKSLALRKFYCLCRLLLNSTVTTLTHSTVGNGRHTEM